MSVRVADMTIFVAGAAQVADAEPILSALLEDPRRAVDVSGAAGLHSATIQLLLALRPQVIGVPADAFAAAWLLPLIATDQRQA